VDFVWTKGLLLVFVASLKNAKAQHLVSRCTLSERSAKLISCHHCVLPFILPQRVKRNICLSR